MRNAFYLACMLVFGSASLAKAEFIGNLEFTPSGCENVGLCSLMQDFEFKDSHNIRWLTVKGDKTDGASIPTWAQPFIGQPFDKSYIKAAVIHDHYCDRHVRPWRQTHLAFYDAMIESGVPLAKAKLMYYAVYLAGPKWVDLISGKKCPGGNCLFSVPLDIGVGFTPPKPVQMIRPSDFNQPGLSDELKKVEILLSDPGNNIDLKVLEQRAEKLRPSDIFYQNGDNIIIKDGFAIQ